MNAPLNPVITKEMIKHSKADPQEKQRQPAKSLTRLTMPDNHRLINWLQSYKPQSGDTLQSITIAAQAALKIEGLNLSHIQHRMQEFGLALPKRVSTSPLVERVAKLEQGLDAIIQAMSEYSENSRTPLHPLIVEYMNSR